MNEESQKRETDNIDLCVRAADDLSKRTGKYITYGIYMGLYHEGKPKIRRRIKK